MIVLTKDHVVTVSPSDAIALGNTHWTASRDTTFLVASYLFGIQKPPAHQFSIDGGIFKERFKNSLWHANRQIVTM